MKVRDVMSTNVEVIGRETTYKEIIERMLEHGVSGLPVVDEHGHLVGIVTEADLIRRQAFAHARPHRILGFVSHLLAGEDPYVIRRCEGLTAGEIMSQPVVTALPDDDLHRAARTMLSHHVKRLPILSEGRPIGIISRVDLMRSFDRRDADIANDVERALANPVISGESQQVTSGVSDGVVTLTGTVGSPSDARVLVALLGRIPGVVDVADQMVAREPERSLGAFDPAVR